MVKACCSLEVKDLVRGPKLEGVGVSSQWLFELGGCIGVIVGWVAA